MEGRATDHRNLDLARLHMEVVRGKSEGKIIWQPRIGCWMNDKLFEKKALPAPYTGMKLPEIYRSLGCSARIYEYNDCFKKIQHPQVVEKTVKVSATVTDYILETPLGKVYQRDEMTPSSWYPLHLKRWVESEDDLKIWSWAEEHCVWEFDKNKFDEVKAEWGDLGAPCIFIPRVNIQDLYVHSMGIENTIYALCDYPETVERYFEILEESHNRLIDVINESPVDIINFGDNVHASTLSPKLFVKYVLPAYQRRCERLHKAGKFVYAHWDGDTKPLLPYAKETGLDGIEAITPKPQGDVTIEEVKEALGDDMFLLDGIAATLFNSYYSEEELAVQAEQIIKLFAPKLILGISDEISSEGDLERIRLIGKIVDDYNCKISMK